MSTHMACRWKTTHELPKSRNACTDDAESTITRPTTTRALTSIAKRTNRGVDRVRGGDVPRPDRFGDERWPLPVLDEPGRRRVGRGRVRMRPAVRVRSVAAGTGVLP